MNRPEWFDKLKPYANHDIRRAVFYILTSFVPYLAIVAIMFLMLMRGYPYWIILVVSIFAVGFYVRTFIIFHDCSHTSFINSKKICTILGLFCGVLTFTPFFDWQRNHGIHHATVSNLDKRGTGDVWTMTLDEYKASNFRVRLSYRLFRNPIFLFIIAPVFLFVIVYRFPQKSTRKKDYFSIIFTDIILVFIVITMHYTVGIKNYIAVQLPVIFIATSVGVWLFYIQHQFEDVYWAHGEKWDLISAALKGASFYNLPGALSWFTGNIGYHNLHHMNPRIPCYNLRRCYNEISELHYKPPITLKTGFKSLRLHLWDEETGRLISFKDAHRKMKSVLRQIG
ncbi:MAG: fatty acid desaturase [Spirochaetota bacterium]